MELVTNIQTNVWANTNIAKRTHAYRQLSEGESAYLSCQFCGNLGRYGFCEIIEQVTDNKHTCKSLKTSNYKRIEIELCNTTDTEKQCRKCKSFLHLQNLKLDKCIKHNINVKPTETCNTFNL